MDKFALVYEFNRESPLMTYQASKEIEIQNYSKALDLLSTAIEKYPNHATAYFLYGLTLAYSNEFDKAFEFISKGNSLLNDPDTLDYYTKHIEKIKRESEGISVDFDETVNEVLNESFIEPDDFDSIKDLGLLDDEFKEMESTVEEPIEQQTIVTETLAEIYASQENFDEAIDVYEKLKDIKPELSEKFKNRITELQKAIENKKQKKFGNR